MIIQQVLSTIERHQLLTQGDRVVVALSGGPDSVCLLHVLGRIREKYGLDLRALHVHHGLRPSADGDAEYSRELAQSLGVPVAVSRVLVKEAMAQTGESVQEAARRLRYAELESFADEVGARRIAVGHHRDDNAETVLLNLLRGTGLRGLRGILPRHGRVVRPLLELKRKQIEAYCERHDLRPRTDPTNFKEDYLRNQVRLSLIPLLEHEYNAGVVDHLLRLADIVREEYILLEDRTEELLDKHGCELESGWSIDLEKLLSLPTADQRRIVRTMYWRALDSDAELGYTHVNLVLELAEQSQVHKYLELPGEVYAVKTYANLQVRRDLKDTQTQGTWEYEIPVPGEAFIKEIGATVRTSLSEMSEASFEPRSDCLVRREHFDYNEIELPLKVRNRRPGDHFQPLGMHGTKKIKDFFMDEKVPRSLREQIPIVVTGDRIIWVAGYRISDVARITPSTSTVLTIEIDGLKVSRKAL